ncbi:E1-E2 ATPase family protein [Trichomonas vaginalis G3]|uniref:E1-E2 ATPase family protein n=1 Tax=Trichomonas vaginalis (strain ATCC PRA-98 / G3) TaxID=412133 RepID=A2D8V9_TRIV3|nr:cation-transporting ATPase-related family [Trichomonas vaginalis G3]EAY22985.1 E1-E2 ATPase family protein [Trichomonas vaginalis G3]KAI5518947.1 cation-transporting ATPase-related family [Trichomonas vaginalis G3]|eukprot:XP_001583971.1 E1-E2 ATPase family protein [Trichomonas vaginalis G3]
MKLLSEAYDPSPPTEITNTTFSFFTDHLNVTMLEPHTFKVLCPFVFIAFHILFYLFTIWVIDFKVLVFYTSAKESDATHVIFYPKLHRGHAEIVPFIRTDHTYAIYQQKRREYVNGTFKSLKYPKNELIKDYLESKGLSSSDAKEKEAYFGSNASSIPVPSFKELLKEHLTTPIFLFQIVSISAWMLDDYIMYPLLTLLSLVLVEANTVRTRQSNMLELRDIETKPIQIRVLRDGLWKNLPSDKLIPGDIVLLNSEIICPADMLLLSGRVVVNEAMLTGESTPQVKECVQTLDPDHKLDFSSDKRYILFGGTRIEQVLPEKAHIFTDQPGAVAYILATGLGSSQGSLLRTILFASERISYESNDSTKLILFLTFFALVASAYIVYFGWGNSSISTFALIVNIIKIITSTIPSDLPMHLTLQVNSSLLALSRLKVFCTEPFRIPFAGTISVCAFDKTGTLTAEDYNLLGIDEINNEKVTEQTINSVTGNFTTDCESLSCETQMVVGGCNSLVFGSNKRLVGDQLEAAAFTALDFKFTTQTNIKNEKCKFQISKIFHFSAQLRRMTTVLTTMSPSKGFEVVTKGAPEVISTLLKEIPENYFETYKKYTKQGCRVLALAHKTLPSQSSLISLTREQCESELTFCGFAIFSAPLKKGTEDTIALLLKSTHRVVIITGDDPLTACHVAKRLHIINCEEFDNLIADEKYDEKCVCYTGNCLQKLSQKELNDVCRKVNVFARMSPENKELVVHTLGNLSFNTMMCGDGTNDVNALKQANCGVGLLENSIDTAVDDETYRPKLGAASVASPFVSKRSTISACTDIIRFGRATLSGTIDLFKLLSLTSLITAYTSSVLFINNVKFGEFQMTIFAVTMTFSYMSVSMAKPVRNLSPERPFRSQFNWYLVTSVLCQFAVHLVFLVLTRNLVFETGYKTPEFDSKVVFSPSLMNTAMFFISNAQQLATFISNYRGKPFMTPFASNKALLWSCIATFVLLFGLLFNSDETLINYFQFVKFPTLRFRNLLALYCFIDIVLCYVIEQILLFLFTLPMKLKSHDLVSQETLDKLKDYKFNDDDQLPENLHKFSFIDMLKENFQLQKNMLIRRIEADKEEKLKNILAKKSGLTKQEQMILKEYKQKIKKNAK